MFIKIVIISAHIEQRIFAALVEDEEVTLGHLYMMKKTVNLLLNSIHEPN